MDALEPLAQIWSIYRKTVPKGADPGKWQLWAATTEKGTVELNLAHAKRAADILQGRGADLLKELADAAIGLESPVSITTNTDWVCIYFTKASWDRFEGVLKDVSNSK